MPYRLVLSAALIFMAALLTSPADAAKLKIWQHNSQGSFDKAQFKQAVVSSEGVLRLSRNLKPLAAVGAMYVWDVVEDKIGNLIVASGVEGKIFKITVDGKVELLYSSGDSQVFCLTQAPDGTIFAGTGPRGTVIRIGADKASVLAEDLDNYVWSLAYDPLSKTLYAGTGPKGKIYQISNGAKPGVFYTTKQEHILRLAMGSNGTLYAGTDKGGMVYRIEPSGKGFVIFHAAQSEIRSLLVTDDAVFAGTGSPISRRNNSSSKTSRLGGGDSSSGDGGVPAGLPEKIESPEAGKPNLPAEALKIMKLMALADRRGGSTFEEGRASPVGAPAPSPPSVGENSLYRIARDGTVRELFREKVMILSMLRFPGRFLLGTGQQGQLFEVNEATKEKTEIARLDNSQINCLLRRRDGSIVLGAGDPGKLFTLDEGFAAKGTIVSDVLDAKIISKWGALSWKAKTPPGTGVSVSVRSGNVPDPDETWSDWSAEQTDAQGSRFSAPTARYLQYRVTLSSQDSRITPEVRGMTVRYQTTNEAPEITSFDVPDIDAGNLDNPRKLKLKWAAVDPNEDELTYDLYFKKDDWKEWIRLERDLDSKSYDWDTTAVPSGIYRLKVVASDRKDNPADEALTAERVSVLFPIAHDPPRVTAKLAGLENGQAVIEALAVDPLVRLTEASFALNGKQWANVFPTDGLFDGKTKQFRFRTDALAPGTHVLVLRVRDAAGNVGSADVVFTVPR